MKSKPFFQVLAIIIATLIIVIISYIFSYNDNDFSLKLKNNDADLTSPSIIKNNGMVISTGTPKLTFINKKVLKAMEASSTSIYAMTEIPQLIQSNNIYWKSINDDILDKFNLIQCPNLGIEHADSGGEGRYTSINDVYESALFKNHKEPKIGISKEEKLDYIARSGLSAKWSATTSLISKGILSLAVTNSSGCYSDYTNYYIEGLNYLLVSKISTTTPEMIKFRDIFIDYDKNKLEIQKIILKKITQNINSNTDFKYRQYCYDEIKSLYDKSLDSIGTDGEYEPFKFSLDKDRINILFFGLPHYMYTCNEPDKLTVNYLDLEPYISPNFKQLLK